MKLFGKRSERSGETPSATLQRGADGLYVIRISGGVAKKTVDAIQQVLKRDIEGGAHDLHVLLVLKDFRGWQKGDDWGDLDFYTRYESKTARMAVVVNPSQQAQVLLFLGAGYRRAEVRCFGEAEEAAAREWLAAGRK